jgi:hypothetical protein
VPGPTTEPAGGDRRSARAAAVSWPAKTFCAAGVGLLLVSLANALARGTETTTTAIYWIGLLLIVLPIFYRLTSREASAPERLFQVCLLGLALYGIKAVRDSLLFTFPDELVHAYSAGQVVDAHHLFESNPNIPIISRYPGLEGATSSLMLLGDASSYVAGTILVAVAKLILMIALFLLFGRISGSARLAGLAVAVYTATPNFLFFNAQFSYESLSLPLLVVVLAAFVEREAGGTTRTGSWTVAIGILIAAIVPTHHLTSYALVILFAALAILYRVLGVPRANPWRFAAFTLVLALAWLFAVAHSTVDYLGPVLTDAVKGSFETASGGGARKLFESTASTAPVTPVLARLISLLGVMVLAAGAGLGLLAVWRHFRRRPFALLFALAAVGFFFTLLLRFAPAAWETGNRAGEFLFIGLAFVAALGALQVFGSAGRLVRLGLAAALALAMVGGAISGWPWDQQLAQPIRAEAHGHEIVSEPLAASHWVSGHLSEGKIAAPEADARLILTPTGREAYGGTKPDIADILASNDLEDWQLPQLEDEKYRYLISDRREIAPDSVRGIYFTVDGNVELYEKPVIRKWTRIPVGRLYSSGRISLFDLEDRP